MNASCSPPPSGSRLPGTALSIVHDDRDRVLAVVNEAAIGADLIITSGGINMGEHDSVKVALQSLGTVRFCTVAMHLEAVGLQGGEHSRTRSDAARHLVSTFVSLHLFAVPAVRRPVGRDQKVTCHSCVPRRAGAIACRQRVVH
jgi:molybdopterin biosynthesis enzyme